MHTATIKRMYLSPADQYGNVEHLRVETYTGANMTLNGWLTDTIMNMRAKEIMAVQDDYAQLMRDVREYNKYKGHTRQ